MHRRSADVDRGFEVLRSWQSFGMYVGSGQRKLQLGLRFMGDSERYQPFGSQGLNVSMFVGGQRYGWGLWPNLWGTLGSLDPGVCGGLGAGGRRRPSDSGFGTGMDRMSA